jgi:hypothetical protein
MMAIKNPNFANQPNKQNIDHTPYSKIKKINVQIRNNNWMGKRRIE